MKSIRVYRSSTQGLRYGNFGDDLTAPLLRHFFHVEAVDAGLRHAHLIATGSILDSYWRQVRRPTVSDRIKHMLKPSAKMLHVWGSGAMVADSQFTWPQRLVVHAVRGPLTARRVPGFSGAIGDPGILVSAMIPPPRASAGVAIVPHFVDEPEVRAMPLPKGWRIVSPDGPPTSVVAQIASAELVISSSLHGIIAADAYGIPTIWAATIRPLAGKNSVYKFHDHAGARGRPLNAPAAYADLLGSRGLAALATTASRDIADWQRELISAFPLAALAGAK